jgi:hypothetical protein
LNSNPCLGFQRCPWFKVIDLNFESFDQIQNFLFRKGLDLSKIGNSLMSKSLDLNFMFEPSPTPICERMSKFFSFESKFWIEIQIPFIEFPYSLIWAFKSILKFYFKIFQTLSSKLFELNLWINVQISIFENPNYHSNFKVPFESIQICNPNWQDNSIFSSPAKSSAQEFLAGPPKTFFLSYLQLAPAR